MKLFSIKAASSYLGGISTSTIRAWMRAGRLRRTRVGRRVMVKQRELDKFVTACNSTEKKKPVGTN